MSKASACSACDYIQGLNVLVGKRVNIFSQADEPETISQDGFALNMMRTESEPEEINLQYYGF